MAKLKYFCFWGFFSTFLFSNSAQGEMCSYYGERRLPGHLNKTIESIGLDEISTDLIIFFASGYLIEQLFCFVTRIYLNSQLIWCYLDRGKAHFAGSILTKLTISFTSVVITALFLKKQILNGY